MNETDRATAPTSTVQARPAYDMLLFALLGAAETQRERLDDGLKAVNLSRPKMEVLQQLVQAGEAVPLRALAEGQHCAPSNMTTLIDRLEADGLVQRVASPDDRRSVRANLTPVGRERAAEGMRVVGEIEAAFAASLSPQDAAVLGRILTALRG